MKVLKFCFVVLLFKVSNAALNVEKTVQQVQNILQANLQLPRLTRDEIIQLMNDIKAEDEKNSASRQSNEVSSEIQTTTSYSTFDNEIAPATITPYNTVNIKKDATVVPSSVSTNGFEDTTKKSESTLMVVLPYTPRDGSSLQELYTRPPRVEVVPLSVTQKPVKTLKSNDQIQETIRHNAKVVNQKKNDFPAELQAFLNAHGLKGRPGQDNFLLPLEGFKPLPPATIIDGSIELPENILLTYDLISPADLQASRERMQKLSYNNFLYDPLRPELPYELDTSSSEIKEVRYPFDMPKSRKTKSTITFPNYDPIDYDSVKVIPLNKGINPIEDVKLITNSEQTKRQANTSEVTTTEAATTTVEPKNAQTDPPTDSSPSADTDKGASIADLEDSFGGAAPSQPGDSELPPPKKNGFYWMLDWNSFLEVGDGDSKINIRFEPKLGDPQMFLPVNVP